MNLCFEREADINNLVKGYERRLQNSLVKKHLNFSDAF